VLGAALVTGCSSGVGRATAAELARRGWSVFATARRPETLADLTGCRALRLDVCDEESMAAAVATVEEEHGAVTALVNNAGYGIEVPVEELSIEDLRVQLETNLVGAVRLIQLVLPAMRRQRRGAIVNVSSVAGRVVLPGGAAYHASKFALEAVSDALRFEVRGFGVHVVVVEPGAISTRWTKKAVASARRAPPGSPYAALREAVAQRLEGAHDGVLARFAGTSDDVARVISRALESPRPRPRYVVPRVAGGFVTVRRLLPDVAWDLLLRRLYPSPGQDSFA
jgi:NAD(P)-dependent dehydrogenase (short-subunit alcohol dehydrogenase family)